MSTRAYGCMERLKESVKKIRLGINLSSLLIHLSYFPARPGSSVNCISVKQTALEAGHSA